MFEILKAGGYIMIPLVLASIVAIGIILERLWTLRRVAVIPPKLGAEVRDWVKSPKFDRSHIEKLRQNSPLGAVLAAIVQHRHRSRDVLRDKAEEAGRQVVHQLSRFLNTLGTIATVAPLLGLLGTVMGLIRMFLVITNFGIGDANKLAGGIGEALVATAAGLCVAILAYLFHRYFRGRVLDLAHELEREAGLLLDALEMGHEAPSTSAQAAAAQRASR